MPFQYFPLRRSCLVYWTCGPLHPETQDFEWSWYYGYQEEPSHQYLSLWCLLSENLSPSLIRPFAWKIQN